MRREFENLSRWIPDTERGRGAAVAVASLEDTPEEFAGDRFRRRYTRVHGPFDGYRVGKLETPVRIYDLSRGGCFVNGTNHQRKETRMVLKIDLPAEGTIVVQAQLVYVRQDFGYAVRFVDVDPDTDARLTRTIEALSEEQLGDPLSSMAQG